MAEKIKLLEEALEKGDDGTKKIKGANLMNRGI